MSNTRNLNLPLIQERQAQKHITLNESLSVLDILTQLAVLSKTENAPPVSLVESAAYIIPPTATGEWASKSGQIAYYQNGAWLYITPKAGFCAWNEADNKHYTYYNDTWHRN